MTTTPTYPGVYPPPIFPVTFGRLDVEQPCEICGGPTRYTTNGNPRHPRVECPAAGGRPRTPAQGAPQSGNDVDNPDLIRFFQATDPDADYATLRRAERFWRGSMRDIRWYGAFATAQNILAGSFGHAQVPALPAPPTAVELGPLGADPEMFTARAWNVRGVRYAPGRELAAYDVNGMYLSAAACELGTGDVDHDKAPDPAAVLKRPGYVRFRKPGRAGLPYGLSEHIRAGMWVPTPVAEYLYDAKRMPELAESFTWRSHRRWLDPHVNLLRSARSTLMESSDPAATLTLAAVKAVYTRIFGGLLASTKHTRDAHLLRPDWRDMIVATAKARMFRGLDRAAGAPVVGIHADAAWFLVAPGADPAGLVVSGQLGKFKPAGRAAWTPELHAAYAAGDHAAVRAALP